MLASSEILIDDDDIFHNTYVNEMTNIYSINCFPCWASFWKYRNSYRKISFSVLHRKIRVKETVWEILHTWWHFPEVFPDLSLPDKMVNKESFTSNRYKR